MGERKINLTLNFTSKICWGNRMFSPSLKHINKNTLLYQHFRDMISLSFRGLNARVLDGAVEVYAYTSAATSTPAFGGGRPAAQDYGLRSSGGANRHSTTVRRTLPRNLLIM